MNNQTNKGQETQAMAVFQQYDKSKYNVLVPTATITQISPYFTATIREVQANSDTNSGDVFKVGTRVEFTGQGQNRTKKFVDLFAPAKPLLNKISQAAGITWDPNRTGPISVSRDYVLYQAVGGIRMPDGMFQVFVAKKEIDLGVIEDELNEQNQKKYRELATSDEKNDIKKITGTNGIMKEDEWVAAQTKSAMIQWRKHKLARAETGAMERVIRQALSMKHQYSEEELKRPFVIPRIDFTPNYQDKDVKSMMLQNGTRAMSSMFAEQAGSGVNPMFVQPFNANSRFTEIPDDDQDESGYNEEEQYPDDTSQDGGQSNQQAPEGGQPPKPETTAADVAAAAEKARQASESNKNPNQCAGCNTFISKAVKTHSENEFKMSLCMPCQDLKRSGKPLPNDTKEDK